MLYSLKEVTIIPASISEINSRSECKIYKPNGKLPLFTAPMSSVVGIKSVFDYSENWINPILPRSVDLDIRLEFIGLHDHFAAFSLNEIEENFLNREFIEYITHFKILIDIANGNMKKMFDIVSRLKEKYKQDIIIMAGNIANPETYEQYCNCGIDYCRVGIGGGAGCLTSTNTGIHYPLASLLMECRNIKEKVIEYKEKFNNSLSTPTQIIADGGIKGYSDIIKALACGADYVMCGSLFAKMEESESPIIIDNSDIKQYKLFYGMSTPRAQIETGGDGSKITEGKEIKIPVKYTMEHWVSNFKFYLQSAMSYCNAKCLDDFIGKVEIGIMSESSINSINK